MRRSLIIYSPIAVLTSIWGLIFFLYFLNPFDFIEIRSYTWIVVFLGLTMIFLGFFTAKFLQEGFLTKDFLIEQSNYPFSLDILRKFILVFTTISLIGRIGDTYLVIKALKDVELFIINPQLVREFLIDVSMGKTSINMMLYRGFNYMGSFTTICVIAAGAISTINKNRFISIYPLLVAAFHSIATLQRVYFIKHYVIWMACAFLAIYFYPFDIQKDALKKFVKKFIFFISIGIFFILAVLVLRHLFSPTTDWQKVVNSFYFYSAGNIFLLDKYLITDPQPLYGLSLFRSFISWFVRFGLLDARSIIAPHYEFYKIYDVLGNTFTYLRIFYEDFNIFGVVFLSYIWGALGYYVISLYSKKFSFFRLGLSSLFIYSFFWSFYGFGLVHVTTLLWKFIQFILLDKFLLYKSRRFLN